MIFNADDVVFSFKRQLDTNHPFHGVTEGAEYEYFNGMSMPALLKDVVKVDDYTVKFVLNRPEAPMIANLGMDFCLYSFKGIRRCHDGSRDTSGH